MTSPEPNARPRTKRRRPSGVVIGATVVGLLLATGAVVYLNRRAAAEALLTGWLERRGVPAEMRVERLDLNGLVAQVRIGPKGRPDVILDRVEVDYAVGLPWSREGLGLTPSRVRLVRPQVRARWADGRWSLGSLDGLIEEFSRRPPRPDSTNPLILIEGGRLTLDTDYGVAPILANARIENGKLMRLVARMPRTVLANGPVQGQGLVAAIDLTTVGDDVRLGVVAWGETLAAPDGFEGRDVRLRLAASAPYPDFERRLGDGRLWSDLRLTAGEARFGDADAWSGQGFEARMTFDGRVEGWLQTLTLQGRAEARVASQRISAGGSRLDDVEARLPNGMLRLERSQGQLRWRLDGAAALDASALRSDGLQARALSLSSTALSVGGRDEAIEATGPVVVRADDFLSGDLRLQDVSGRGDLDLISDGRLAVTLDAELTSAGGGWDALGSPSADDVPQMAALKNSLGDFSLSAPQLAIRVAGSETSVRLVQPVELRPRNGGLVSVAALGETPVFRNGQGAARIVAELPGSQPSGAVDVPDWRLTPDGFAAQLDGDVRLDFGIVTGVSVDGGGRLASSGGRLTFTAEGCPDVGFERLELGENDIIDLTGRLCADQRPTVDMRDGRWTAAGRLEGVTGSAPFLALAIQGAAGPFTATGGPEGLGLAVTVDEARIADTTTPRRFNPLTGAGRLSLAQDRWRGDFDLGHDGVTLGHLALNHDARAGGGGLTIDAPRIVFAEGGLQPEALSPLAAEFVKSPATGEVGFTGHVDWVDGGEGSSGGVLTIPSLDFTSPVGPVRSLQGRVEFTSLAPLETAPNQHLTAREIETAVTLSEVNLDFGLGKNGVMLDAGETELAGGRARIEPFLIPLDPTQPIQGVLVLDQVQLGELIQEAGFGERVQMDAVVSGRLPFTRTPDGRIRVTGGALAAVQPGRVSINREALSGVEAGGGGEEVPPNTVQDLAYQAMENLAFNTLTADLNSLDEGRLSVRFHIVGAFDPPQRQELRLTIPELVSRSFLQRQLPLPSGTGVDLTLDTTLNFDQLLEDLAAVNRARRGEAETSD